MKNQLENQYPRLTECERIVMEILWNVSEDISLIEILAIIEEKHNRDWKRQTVATFLSHIIKKGLISAYRIGRIFFYRVEVKKIDYIRQEAPDIIRYRYSDNVGQFLFALNESRGFTSAEKETMLQLVNS